jgi:hypothetical protein
LEIQYQTKISKLKDFDVGAVVKAVSSLLPGRELVRF